MKIIFLGTNGWYTTDTGNTTCVLIDSRDYYIVFDAGNGIYKLDRYITVNKQIYLFLSHFHVDHISGLQTLLRFKFHQGIKIYIQEDGKRAFNTFMDHPFTFSLDRLPYKTELNELSEGEHRIPFKVTARKLQHVETCFGYRLELDGKTVTYATDTGVCENDYLLAKNADLLIHECANPVSDKSSTNGQTGPSEAAKLAKDANVKKLVMMHFSADMYKKLEQRKEAEKKAREIFKNTFAASDGQEIDL